MSEVFKDYFEILGVTPDDSNAAIAEAFRRKARSAHPDVAGGSHDAFVELQDACDCLTDSRRRADYLRLHALEIGRRSLVYFGPLVRDLYDDMLEYVKDVVGIRRSDAFGLVTATAYRSLDRIFELDLRLESICGSCKGIGSLMGRDCRNCSGTGVTVEVRRHEVMVPKHAKDGAVLTCELPDRRLAFRISYR